MNVKIAFNDDLKIVSSQYYNYIFNKKTGYFARWGETKEQDPTSAPSAEILDIEISAGKCSMGCKACYKSNTPGAKNVYMTLDTYKNILDKMGPILCQVALGITDIDSNPDLWAIMEYTRSKGVIPNITVNGRNIKDEDINRLASLCGAVSVSRYNDDECYGTVKRLTDAMANENATLRQVNIHQILCAEKLDDCYKVIRDVKTDARLAKLNAVVLMTLKPKGNRNTLTSLNSLEKFQALFKAAVDSGVAIGMDSCAAPQAFKAIEKLGMLNVAPSVESCESAGLFSAYIDVNGFYFPCSFAAQQGEWQEGISVINVSDFAKDIWNHPKVSAWRTKCLSMTKSCGNCRFAKECRPCPLFDITPCFKLK